MPSGLVSAGGRRYQVRLFGKGREERVCPLWPETAALLPALLTERATTLNGTALIFVNAHGQPLTLRREAHRQAARSGRRHDTFGLGTKRIHPHAREVPWSATHPVYALISSASWTRCSITYG